MLLCIIFWNMALAPVVRLENKRIVMCFELAKKIPSGNKHPYSSPPADELIFVELSLAL